MNFWGKEIKRIKFISDSASDFFSPAQGACLKIANNYMSDNCEQIHVRCLTKLIENYVWNNLTFTTMNQTSKSQKIWLWPITRINNVYVIEISGLEYNSDEKTNRKKQFQSAQVSRQPGTT